MEAYGDTLNALLYGDTLAPTLYRFDQYNNNDKAVKDNPQAVNQSRKHKTWQHR